jgi:N-acetyltransferase
MKAEQNRSSSPSILKLDLPSESIPPPSTPPSSPPPETSEEYPQDENDKPLRAPSPHPLLESNPNTRQKPKPPDKPRFQKFTQLTLDLGQPTEKHCKECGMTYRPSNAEDRETHKRYHAKQKVEVELSRAFVQSLLPKNVVWRDNEGTVIAKVTSKSTLRNRAHVEKVLDVVERELGGVGIPFGTLWRDSSGQRYAVFLYIRGDQCLGVCVAQEISKARRVLASQNGLKVNAANGSTDKSIVASEEYPARLGISRIWASKGVRRKGISRTLLDTAISNFEFAVTIPKQLVAFSQPTDSGARLARSWFGKEDGWLVYAE